MSPCSDRITEQFINEQYYSRGITSRITDTSCFRCNNNSRDAASHVPVMSSFHSQHANRGINSNVNAVSPHVGLSSASNSSSGNNIRRGYKSTSN